ncbi:helix-turn-helix domain-containing protein [Flagellimonas zhangzhouensis]|uniref:Helix-turn-helix domain-containing protein n=1 Tax=Flagellimonas zhangzhouensis TaxID=1073328 RepID=A0A1H2UAL6_9FLAO|nr:helix-turn-helix transcriptional regulator [Allomuricauda zhangzhouensis]SDQ18684.1 Helix-turn-helix domain-containing protein [Allomuricauda zhangzhouensis]SDW53166.1 Helix-turn-helix domain-containing protein [Allomuricauda zhangzhouensis]
MDKSSEKEFLVKFGQNLRRLRKQKGYTQEELANELDIEISQISRIERGVINTSVSLVKSIVDCLQVKANELFD